MNVKRRLENAFIGWNIWCSCPYYLVKFLTLKTANTLWILFQKQTSFYSVQFSSVLQSCLMLCDPMDYSTPGFPVHHQLWELAQTPSSLWCHPTISSSVIPYSSCLQSSPASGSFAMSQFFPSGGSSIGVSASTSVLPMYIQLISFRTDWLDLLEVQGTLSNLLQHHSSKASILQHSAFFIVQLSHPHLTTGKTISRVDGPLSAK